MPRFFIYIFEESHASTSGLNASTHHVTGFDPSLFGGRQKFGLGQHFIKEIGLAVRIRKTTVCCNVLNEGIGNGSDKSMWCK